MTGMQDTNLALRETLKSFFNTPEYTEELKSRWITNRKALLNTIKMEFDKDYELMLEKEWWEITNMKKMDKSESDQATLKPTPAPSNSPSLSLIFLEDIHIFGLANLLLRPIIVISQKTVSDIQQCDLRGIYLPLLRKTDACIKDPIIIAYHSYHFMPLVFPMDEETFDAKNTGYGTREYFRDEKFHHFHNIDIIDSQSLNNDTYDTIYGSKLYSSRPFLNALPLVDFNLDMFKVRFCNDSEDKNHLALLKRYLK
jgi:hypothetical protein